MWSRTKLEDWDQWALGGARRGIECDSRKSGVKSGLAGGQYTWIAGTELTKLGGCENPFVKEDDARAQEDP